jgi:hypothetical protein
MDEHYFLRTLIGVPADVVTVLALSVGAIEEGDLGDAAVGIMGPTAHLGVMVPARVIGGRA